MEKAKGAGARSRRSYHHGDLRQAALQQALEHINRARDVSFTLRELAAALGVSSTALYRHFDGKLALLAAVAEEGYKELLRRFDTGADAAGDAALQRMASCGEAYVHFALTYPAHFRVMFLPQLRQAGEFPALSDLRQQVYARLEGALLRLEQENLLSDAGVREIALTSWATVHGLASLLVDGHVRIGTEDGKKQLQGLVRQVLAVQAEGFLADGVKLGPQAGTKPAATRKRNKAR